MPGTRVGHLLAGMIAASLASAALSACTATNAPTPTGAAVRGLFRSGGSSYPNGGGGWYAPAQPPHFSQTGAVAWQREAGKKRGVGGWFTRLLKRKPAEAAMPTAVIAADAALAVPSIVTVTNINTYTAVTVRVEQRAPLGGALISLNRETASALKAEPGKPLKVRVRYAGPVIAYRERPDVRQALRRPAKRDVQLAAAAKPPPPVQAAPKPTPVQTAPATVARAEAPPAVLASVDVPVKLRPAIQPPPPMAGWRVQAGAFAERRNADRAVVMLKAAGPAAVELVQGGQRTLYRVSLLAPTDAKGAEALRMKVVKAGFADARLVRLS